jgi:hypothetical protein
MSNKSQKRRISRKCGFHDKTATTVQTPPDLYDALNREFNFDFDPCPLDPQPKVDGLKIEWKKSNFVNPPYDKVGIWIEKAITEAVNSGNKSVFLIPFRANTKYFTEMVFRWCTNLYVFSKRIIFAGYSAPLPLLMCLVVFDPEKMQCLEPSMVLESAHGLPTKDFGNYSTVILK